VVGHTRRCEKAQESHGDGEQWGRRKKEVTARLL
jgi:hypothetical protein